MKRLALPILLLLATFAAAQTTYTVTKDSCGGKANQYCYMPSTDGTSQFIVVMDTRVNGTGPINHLSIYTTTDGYNVGTLVTDTHGTFSGFVSNPDGTRNPFYGTASYVSDDGTVTGTMNFYAKYVSVCSGRGCGGTLGWHYTVLAGSAFEGQ